MDSYCNVCDRLFKIKSKRKLFQSLTHKEFEKSIRMKHPIQDHDFFDIDEIFNE